MDEFFPLLLDRTQNFVAYDRPSLLRIYKYRG